MPHPEDQLPAGRQLREDAAVPDGLSEGGVMSSLPRRRPQLRSPRRQASAPRHDSRTAQHSRPASVDAQAGGEGLRLVPNDPAVSGTAVRAARRRARLEHDLQPPASFTQLAVDGVVEVARLPLRAGAQITTMAFDAISRGIRR
jgi:hypothetical protein